MIAGFGWLLLPISDCQTHNAMQDKDGEKAQILQGRDVYLRYCASCHGVDAKGRGAVSAALRKRSRFSSGYFRMCLRGLDPSARSPHISARLNIFEMTSRQRLA